MRILLISYGDIHYDGRLRRLINVFESIGELYIFTKEANTGNDRNIFNKNYLKFIRNAVIYGKKIGSIDCLVLDNRKATIPGLILKNIVRPRTIIQDCRELYLINEIPNICGKIGCIFEKIMIKKADIIICANGERAKFMKKYYKLRTLPLIYENLRKLEYESEEAKQKAREKLSKYLQDEEYRIISTSGCSVSRTNDILVKNLKRVSVKCRLFLVGKNKKKDEKYIRKLIKENELNNIEILDRLSHDELKYLIQNSHIGIVNYHQKDLNNKYCASGKIYEFLYEGLPVVTTTNPPLKSICSEAGVGITDDRYADGINELIRNYKLYKWQTEKFAKETTVENNDENLRRKLLDAIRATMNRR